MLGGFEGTGDTRGVLTRPRAMAAAGGFEYPQLFSWPPFFTCVAHARTPPLPLTRSCPCAQAADAWGQPGEAVR